MIINELNLKALVDLLNSNVSTVLVKGEKGLLKSSTIKQFLADKTNAVTFKGYLRAYSLEGIYDSVYAYAYKNIKKANKLFARFENLTLQSRLFALIKYLCSERELILYFDNLPVENNVVMDFVQTLIDNQEVFENRLFLIAEVDENGLNKDNISILHKIFYSSPSVEYIPFTPYNNFDMVRFVLKLYPDLKCRKEDLNYVIETANGNPGLLIIVLNFLKERQLLTLKNSEYILRQIPLGIFLSEFSAYIQKKYQKLNSQEQEVLKSSFCIGYTFEQTTLNNAFNLISANEILKRIEEVSALVIKEKLDYKANDCLYSFRTQDIFSFVGAEISEETKKEKHAKLSCYYGELLMGLSKIQNPNVYISNLYKHVVHSFQAQRYLQIKERLVELVSFYTSIHDYERVNSLAEKVKPIYFLSDYEIYVYLVFAQSQAAYFMGEYESTIACLTELLKHNRLSDGDRNFIKYKLADAYLITEQIDFAQSILLELLTIEIKSDLDKFFLMKVYRSLASLYDFINKETEKTKYFTKSINLSKALRADSYYYSLLRQSSMCYPLNDARKMMLNSLKYFTDKKDLVEQAKCCHNLATDAIYLGKYDDCKKYILLSIKYFESYGSKDRASALNTLGIYYALAEANFEDAEKMFLDALSIANSDWVRITVLNNLMTIAIMTRNKDNANKYMSLIEQNYHDGMPLAKVYIFFAKAQFHKLNGNVSAALDCFQSISEYKLSEYRHKTLAAMFYNDLSSTKIEYAKDNEIINYLNDCHEKNCFWGTIRFWES